jgi:hypothetical protein
LKKKKEVPLLAEPGMQMGNRGYLKQNIAGET